ncbi:hypothetical protein QTI66_00150 [Variovorax sp. J22R133]|uniref:hypothetical protein n=1 Tax=Variovorax brevis TaxID=3053503 RepID=UPI002574BACC|nr:hypothetical protein [Variovorax sp. J22R133]MDM0110538.1 hypothetical protein [Variovorax sp. J22R133]
MPIVFVHGVNNRNGDEYRDNELGRDEFLREIVAPALGLSPKEVYIESPYWGGNGVQFSWGLAVLPDAEESYEKFGADGDAEAFGRTVELVAMSPPMPDGIVNLAKANFAEAVDLVYGAALAGTEDKADANALAKSYRQAIDYAGGAPDLTWLDNATDETFADLLNHYVHKEDDEESMGGGGVLDQLKEGLSRLVQAVPDAGSALLAKVGRKKLNTTITRFAGDAFVYLTRRGEPGKEGPIVQAVLESLKAAHAAKTPKDDKLIVIAHSFGGEIMYDILTRFWPELEVECLITVGSQVGLFEEMKLYLASDPQVPKHYPDGQVPKPSNVKRWLNVFDRNDVLSFRVRPIFEGAQDFEYDTGYSTLQAHGGYFLRPSFYSRLAARLKE